MTVPYYDVYYKYQFRRRATRHRVTDIRKLESRSFFVPGRVDAAVTFAMGPYDAKSSFDFHDNGRELECTSFRDDRQASGLSIFNERNSRPLRHYDDLSSAP